MSTPKGMVKQFLAPLAQMEASIKKPLNDAGFHLPEIPTPAGMAIKLIEALPEFPAMVPFARPIAPPARPPPTPPAVVAPRPYVKYG